MSDSQQKLKQLEKIIALLPGNVYWKDRNGVYQGCNDLAAKLVKLKSRFEIIGKTLYDIADPKYADVISRTDEHIMATDTEMVLEESAFDVDGNPAVYFTRKVPLHDDEGNVNGLLGISIDITERKILENALQEAKIKAESSNAAKSEFIRNISHDLRTPFNSLLGFSKMLRNKETDPEKKQMLCDVVQSAEKLLEIITDVIDLSAIESGQDKNQIIQFSIIDIIEHIKVLLMSEIKQKKIELITHFNPDIPQRVLGDKMKIYRIILNLLANAIKFTHNGFISIDINSEKITEKKLLLVTAISDTGIGIPKEKQNIIFDRFSRLTSSYQGQYEGSGLGLYIVKQFLQELGGEITVESEVGKGSTFTCSIPLELTE